MNNFEIVVVGAGISGAVIAERYAKIKNKKVLVIEKRKHIGGNCHDYYNKAGILVPKYGPHFFHTNSSRVWKYVSNFTDWIFWKNRVLSSVDGKLVPVPVNIETVNTLFGLNIQNEAEMLVWLNKNTKYFKNPKNSEEVALSQVGKKLYEKMFKNYTKKQWGLHPRELHPSVIRRIPVRTNFENCYYSDKYQAIPKHGYTKIFQKMLTHPNITVRLATDFTKIRNKIGQYEKLFFTGRIDHFFNDLPLLPYRSIRFKHQTLNKEFHQTNCVINHPNKYKFTRITEPKHATGQKHTKTTIIKEYPTTNGEPLYPILNDENIKLYKKYEKKARELKNVHFLGRLANYSYINMDEAFLNALNLFESI